MKIEFDEHKFKPIVTLSENEIKSAFESPEQFLNYYYMKLLANVMANLSLIYVFH